MRRILIPLGLVTVGLCLGLSIIANVWLALNWQRSDALGGDSRAQVGVLQATASAQATTMASLQAQVETQRREADELHRRLVSAQTQVPPTPTTTPSPTATHRATATPAPTTKSSANFSLMDTIQEQVSALRNLEPKRPVERTVMTADELREYVTREFELDYPQAEADADQVTLGAFGLIDPDLNLHDFYVDLYSEQIAGFYDSQEEQLFVISDLAEFGPLEKTTFAHEYEHALQDQHFDLDGLGLDDESDSQRSEAVRALAEGDAVLVMQQYVEKHFGAAELLEMLGQLGQADQSQLENAPSFFQAELDFPYTYGLAFVQDFYDEGGWEAVNEVWRNPPASTEQILHPDRYRAGDAPEPVTLPELAEALGDGWELLEEDSLGEFLLRMILAAELDEDAAADAAMGWGGDRYAVYYHEGESQTVLVQHTLWDEAAEATEFASAYSQYADARFGDAARVERAGGRCWAGDSESVCLISGADEVLVVQGPNLDVIEGVIAEFSTFR
jgi:hypothetical protein